jgi:hypothetical protein
LHPVLRNIVAVVVGWLVGSVVNGCIVLLSNIVVPLPEGADISTLESLQASIPLFSCKHFIMPFLAHALGTFVGAMVAAFIARNHKMRSALSVGVLFLVGGIINLYLLNPPLWFILVDLLLAYLPMAFLGGRIVLWYQTPRK